LLRFSSTPLDQLIVALRERFDGIGKPDLVEVQASRDEYMVLDKKFGFLYHPWTKLGEATVDDIHARECRRLPFLANKLIEDLVSAEKIFLYRSIYPADETELLCLHSTIQSYGPATLLWIVLQDQDNPTGTVKELSPGFFKGYIDRFAPLEQVHELSFEGWTSLCRNAYKLYQSRKTEVPSD
jgi:hypothetical protein